MTSIKMIIVRFCTIFLIVILMLVLFYEVYLNAQLDILYYVGLIPALLVLSIVITAVYSVCSYCREESKDGWIVVDSSSETEIPIL